MVPSLIFSSNSEKSELSAIKECLIISANPSDISSFPIVERRFTSIKTRFG